MSARAAADGAVRQERGKQFWTVENLTSAPVLLVVATVLLCTFGLIMIFSASSIESVEAGQSAWSEFLSQLLFTGLALVACLVVRVVGGSFWVNRLFYVLWGAVVLLLVLVLVAGNDSHGATRWVSIAGFSLQPSEFAKIALIMAAARVLTGWEQREYSWKRCLAYLGVFILLPFVLILLQKDLGTLLIVGATVFLMAILAHVRPAVLVGILALGAVAVLALIFSAGYRSSRFTIWLDPYSDYYGDGWQPIHGLYAFASGGFFGLGLGNSRQKYSYLPEAENDFIFSIIGEELGFLGTISVILLFVLWGWSGMRIAYQARERDRVSSLMAFGLTIIIEVQALLNMGGVLGVLPLSGRPLPFISSGGSSILANLIMVGLLLGVARENAADDFERTTRSPRISRSHLTVLDGGAAPPVEAREPVFVRASGRAGGRAPDRGPAASDTNRRAAAPTPRAASDRRRAPRAGGSEGGSR